MRRVLFFIAIFLFTLSSVMGQMIPINLPADGNWPTIVGDSIMIIGPRQNELTEEQRYFNPVYLMTYPGKEHLKAQMIRAGACDCDPTIPNRRIGVFSVAPNKQVSFSQGNLQYLPAINLWKFANTQYEYLGNANKYLKPTFRNWVDLFGWSANNTTAPFGVSTSTNVADYAGDFVDWGTNTICGDAPNTWRTLSIEEWKYLYHERKNADKLFALGTINGIAGMILLPDDWQLPEGATCQLPTEKGLLWDDNYNGGGYINTNTQANHYQDNIYTLEQWQVMEEAGAVFLPAAGYRENTNFSTQSVNPPSDYVGSYATSTIADKNNYYFMRFIHREVRKYSHSLYRGRSVRLVHDTIVPRTILKRIGVFSVAADKQVSFSQGNLQYIQSTKTWQFANNQLEYMGHKHFRNGQLADTIEYFGWSGKDSKAPWGISLSTESSDYEGEFLDWGTNTIAGSAPNTWRTLSNDEWLYICQGRKNADQLLGLGKISSIFGLIILPDDWVAPEGITFTPNDNNPNANVYSLQQWTAMEEAGAIFIPPTGYFNHDIDNMRYVGTYGYARNNTLTANGLQIYTLFKPSEIQYSRSAQGNNGNLYYAFPQRLVHDTIVSKTIPDPCMVIKVNDTLSINMMCVEGGTFMMGSDVPDAEADEQPVHEVTLSDYYIGQTEVTQHLWKAVMGSSNNPSATKVNNLPVTNISWDEAQQFVQKLSEMTGMHFRLPTEAEWEYAARGGQYSRGYKYAGSNDIDEVGWYNGNSSNKTHAVGQKQPNELGIYDMTGNVWEYCYDWHMPYSAQAQTNPTGAVTGEKHVLRGGCYHYDSKNCTSTNRHSYYTPDKGGASTGLRIVLEP